MALTSPEPEGVYAFLARCAREGQTFDEVWRDIRRRSDFYRKLAEDRFGHERQQAARPAEDAAYARALHIVKAGQRGETPALPGPRPAKSWAEIGSPPVASVDVSQILDDLKGQVIRLKGVDIPTEDATVEQLEAKAAALYKTASGHRDRADRLMFYAKLCRDGGVDRLAGLRSKSKGGK